MDIWKMPTAISASKKGIYATYQQQIANGSIKLYAADCQTYKQAVTAGTIQTYQAAISSGNLRTYQKAIKTQ
jgi:hypothetical protein